MFECFYNRRIFTDFDELAENLRDWELEIFQLEKGSFVNSIEQLSSGELLISAAQFSGHTHQVGNSPSGRTFAILADAETHITWRKHSIAKDSLMIFPVGGEFDVTTPKGLTNVITLSVSDKVLHKVMTDQDNEKFMEVVSENEVITLPDNILQQLRLKCGSYFHLLQNEPELVHSTSFQEEFTQNILVDITEFLSTGDAQNCQPTIKNVVWDRIDEELSWSLEKPLSVHQLSIVAQVSERTLRRYFHNRFAISPKIYLNQLRLNKVRIDLQRATQSNGIITNIANKWGFWHMGQFAHDYRRLFGELPSDTVSNYRE